MKPATGAIFIPRLLDNMKAKSCCSEHGGQIKEGICDGGDYEGYTIGELKKVKECK